MALLSFLRSLICKKCKKSVGCKRVHRLKERLQHQTLKKNQNLPQQQPSQQWQMSSEHERNSVTVCSAEPVRYERTRSAAELDSVPMTGICLTTTITTTTIYVSHSSTSTSSHAVIHRVPGIENLRLLAEKYKKISSVPPQLTLPWERQQPSPLVVEIPSVKTPVAVKRTSVETCPISLDADSLILDEQPIVLNLTPVLVNVKPTMVNMKPLVLSDNDKMVATVINIKPKLVNPKPTFVNVKHPSPRTMSPAMPVGMIMLPARPMKQRYPMKPPCAIPDMTSEFSSSPWPLIPTQIPVPLGSLMHPISPLEASTHASFANRIVSRHLLLEKSSTDGSTNAQTRRLLSGSTVGSGQRYIPSSKSLPRKRRMTQSTPTQTTLPFLRPCTTFEEILSSSSSSPSSSSSSSCSSPTSSSSSSSSVSSTSSTELVRYQPSALQEFLNNSRLSVRQLPTFPPHHKSAKLRSQRIIHYDSHQGYNMLQALRRLLSIPVEWSAAQTLLYILRHPAVRRLNLPSVPSSSTSKSVAQIKKYHDIMRVPQCNALGWHGILQSIDGAVWYRAMNPEDMGSTAVLPAVKYSLFSYSERKLISSWLESGENLFTQATPLSSLLLREGVRFRAYQAYTQPWRDTRKGTTLATFYGVDHLSSLFVQSRDDQVVVSPISEGSRYRLKNNPRCRFHQLWTGSGSSPLSNSIIASC
ncbi:hypothetical protein SEUCBS139899_008408 [Sporothrix eucalyptigena]|uniref:Uncharacterized protein n=1 Tax=Sporothrix eucalyptigena TaxID=1812306 RepID=A0ABP0D284_9PEZI